MLHMTWLWYYPIPAQGTPTKILHKTELPFFDDVPGERRPSLSWQEQHAHPKQALASFGQTPKICM